MNMLRTWSWKNSSSLDRLHYSLEPQNRPLDTLFISDFEGESLAPLCKHFCETFETARPSYAATCSGGIQSTGREFHIVVLHGD